MGPHMYAAGGPGTGKPGKTDPGVKYTGRPLHHQPGKCGMAGGLLPERLAVRHGDRG